MSEEGFPSTRDQFGQRAIEFSKEQHDAMKFAQYTCYARYPLEDKYLRPYTVDQLRSIYDWNVNQVSECLRAQGVEPSPPPSFEVFVGRYANTGREHWAASEGIDLASLRELCPDKPPDEVLYP